MILWGGGVIAAAAASLLASYVFAPALKNAIQARAVASLKSEFASNVQFQSFDIKFWPRIHVMIRGVRIGDDTASPLMQATMADAQSDLLPWHIRTLVLEGLSLHIPTAKRSTVTTGKPALTVTIEEIVSEYAQLEILPVGGQQTPLHFELAHLRVRNFAPNSEAGFSALIVNSQPRADIQSSGRLGPWNVQDPSLTPVRGSY